MSRQIKNKNRKIKKQKECITNFNKDCNKLKGSQDKVIKTMEEEGCHKEIACKINKKLKMVTKTML